MDPRTTNETDPYLASPVGYDGQKREMFGSAAAAWTYADELRRADQMAAGPTRQKILAFEQGAAPLPRATAPTNAANINWRESCRALNRSQELYTAYALEDSRPFSIKRKRGREVDKDDIAIGISTSATAAWETWEGRDIEIGIVVRETCRYGLGAAFWPDSTSPKFRALYRDEIFFEDRAGLDIDTHVVVAIRQTWTAFDLFEILDNPSAEKVGWKPDAIRDLIKSLPLYGDNTDLRHDPTWEEIERERHRNATGCRRRQQSFEVYLLYAKSIETGKIDLYVVSTDKNASQGSSSSDPVRRFLRHQTGHADKMSCCIALFPRYLQCKTLQDLRGVGHEVTPAAILSSRVKCRLIDSVAHSTTSWFRAADSQAAARSEVRQISQWGNFGVVPDTLAAIETPVLNLKDSFAFSLQWLQLEIGEELAHDARGTEPAKPGDPQIPPQDRLSVQERKAFLTFLNAIYREAYRRMQKAREPMGKEFEQYLEYYAIPLAEAHPDELCYVRASRPIGNGSLEDLREIAGALLSVRSQPGSEGAHKITETFIAAWVGEDNMRKYCPPYQELNQPDQHQRKAQEEHNQALAGMEVFPPIDGDNHAMHLRRHFELLDPDVKAWQSGQAEQDPEFLSRFGRLLGVMVPHLRVHAEKLSADPTMKPVADSYRRATEELVRIANSVFARMKAAQDQAQAAQQRMQGDQIQQLLEAAQQPPPPDQKALQAISASQAEHEQRLRQQEESHRQGLALRQQEAILRERQARVDEETALRRAQTDQATALAKARTEQAIALAAARDKQRKEANAH